MSRVGFPDLGPEYSGLLHRHPPTDKFPEMKKHVVVDLEDWRIARLILKDIQRFDELLGGSTIESARRYLNANNP